jgi:Zn-dependent protease
MGGIPLPGGVTYIRMDLIPKPWMRSAVSLSGPAMNFLLFLLFLLPLHPALGYLDSDIPLSQWTNTQIFLAAMSTLMLVTCIFNLIPVPPLDGFGVIAPWLPLSVQQSVSRPGVQVGMLVVLFVFAMNFGIRTPIETHVLPNLLSVMGFPSYFNFALPHALDYTLFGSP